MLKIEHVPGWHREPISKCRFLGSAPGVLIREMVRGGRGGGQESEGVTRTPGGSVAKGTTLREALQLKGQHGKCQALREGRTGQKEDTSAGLRLPYSLPPMVHFSPQSQKQVLQGWQQGQGHLETGQVLSPENQWEVLALRELLQ